MNNNNSSVTKFISICIPSYNRPKELERLLFSIDYRLYDEVEIVICEDNSPKRLEVRDVVSKFIDNTKYNVIYVENNSNFGYDKNLRELIKNATGEYIIFMGDDDEFVAEALSLYVDFLHKSRDLGYILKTSRTIKKDNSIEEFRYYKQTVFFEPGFETYIALFRKSVFISGFTFKRELILELLTNKFDGTLLFQLYILSEIVMSNKSAYCDILLTQQYEDGIPLFGSSESERLLYTPGTITISNSLNFINSFFRITTFIDSKYNLDSTSSIKKDMSKYSFPILSIQRNKGVILFIKYYSELNKLGINCTLYYYLYFVGLLFVGEKTCGKIIQLIKKLLKRTPHL